MILIKNDKMIIFYPRVDKSNKTTVVNTFYRSLRLPGRQVTLAREMKTSKYNIRSERESTMFFIEINPGERD